MDRLVISHPESEIKLYIEDIGHQHIAIVTERQDTKISKCIYREEAREIVKFLTDKFNL